mgnify:FL=1|jgi:carbonic anhydrase
MKIKSLIIIAVAATQFIGCVHTAQEVKPHKTHTAHWEYNGELGPESWGKASAICTQGQEQSPVNIISDSASALKASNTLDFHEATKATIAHEVDNGHAIKITPEGDHGVSVRGVHYKLLQFHFHGKSENRIDGKQFDMEMHLVHQNAEGQLLVVAVMIEEGVHNSALEGVLSHLDGGDIEETMTDILPKDTSHYYHFKGSLTTPPCSENVLWYVLKNTITIDNQQLASFRSHHKENFRPIQALNARHVEAN